MNQRNIKVKFASVLIFTSLTIDVAMKEKVLALLLPAKGTACGLFISKRNKILHL